LYHCIVSSRESYVEKPGRWVQKQKLVHQAAALFRL